MHPSTNEPILFPKIVLGGTTPSFRGAFAAGAAALFPAPRHSAAALLVTAFAVLGALFLSSCATLKAPGTQAKLKATGWLVLAKARDVAVQTVLSAAISQADGTAKGDFLDSAATGLRSEMGSILTKDDVARVVRIWTPAQQDGPAHWQALAAQLARTYAAAAPQDKKARAQVIEAIAEGLQLAAQSQASAK